MVYESPGHNANLQLKNLRTNRLFIESYQGAGQRQGAPFHLWRSAFDGLGLKGGGSQGYEKFVQLHMLSPVPNVIHAQQQLLQGISLSFENERSFGAFERR